MTEITIQPNVVEKEGSKSAPTPAEIRLRAFEIHIERGGIHRLALDTWEQTYANSDKSPKTGKESHKEVKSAIETISRLTSGAQP